MRVLEGGVEVRGRGRPWLMGLSSYGGGLGGGVSVGGLGLWSSRC